MQCAKILLFLVIIGGLVHMYLLIMISYCFMYVRFQLMLVFEVTLLLEVMQASQSYI